MCVAVSASSRGVRQSVSQSDVLRPVTADRESVILMEDGDDAELAALEQQLQAAEQMMTLSIDQQLEAMDHVREQAEQHGVV